MNNYDVKEIVINKSKISFLKGDITRQKTGAIVNAANSSLMGGGGVDGAIHRAGGPVILEECKEIIKKIGRLAAGQAVITSGGNLPAKYVIHTVGPIYNKAKAQAQAEELRNCYVESLKIAAEKGLKSISFPSISTGAYRYPLSEAAPIAVAAAGDFLRDETSIKEVYFVLYNEETYKAFASASTRMV